jgi:Tfp pilus assembly protein PilV
MKTATKILILRDLEFGSATSIDLTALVKLHLDTVQRVMYSLHREKLVWISAWERHHGKPRPVWALGSKKDAPKPIPFTNTEKRRKWRLANREKDNATHKRYRDRKSAQRSSASTTQTSTSLSGI